MEGGFRWLQRNKKEDAIAYFDAFANMLEEKLIEQVEIDFSSITTIAVAEAAL